MVSVYDPFDTHAQSDPFSEYRILRDRERVFFSPPARAFCLSRYEDVLFALKSPAQFSSRAMFTMLMNNGSDGPPPLTWQTLGMIVRIALRTRLNPFTYASARNLIAEDGERHARLRDIVNRGFTPRRIATWESRARAIVGECLGGLGGLESFDVMKDLAIPLPVTLIAEMLGVESERRAEFKGWSDQVIYHATGPGRADPFSRPWQEAMIGLTRCVQEIARDRRRAPADDLISVLVGEQLGEVALSDREVVQFAILLLVAGNETTTNLIGNAVTALLDHPDALDRVARDPSLVPRVIEETLRYDSPIQLVVRCTTEDVEICGTRIPKGANVVLLLGSANRDERQFPEPDRFDLDREPRGHLGFGFGAHFCLGSSLARLEANAALEVLVPLLGRFERKESERTFVDSFLVRGPSRLELRATA